MRGRSFDFARLFRICDTAPQHFNVFAMSSSLNIYSSSLNGNDLYNENIMALNESRKVNSTEDLCGFENERCYIKYFTS